MPINRTFYTPYGTVRITAVRLNRIHFNAFSPEFKLTVAGNDFAVSMSLDYANRNWIISDDGRGIADERLRFVARPAATRYDPDTELAANHPVRTGVINQVVPRIITWANENRSDLLGAEKEVLEKEIIELAADENRTVEALTHIQGGKTTRQNKLSEILAELGQ